MSLPAWLYRGDHGHLKFPTLPMDGGHLRMGRYVSPIYGEPRGNGHIPVENYSDFGSSDAVGPYTMHPLGIPLEQWQHVFGWFWRVKTWKLEGTVSSTVTQTYDGSTWQPAGTYTATVGAPTITSATNLAKNEAGLVVDRDQYGLSVERGSSTSAEASQYDGGGENGGSYRWIPPYWVEVPIEYNPEGGYWIEGSWELAAGVAASTGYAVSVNAKKSLFYDGKIWPEIRVEAWAKAWSAEDEAVQTIWDTSMTSENWSPQFSDGTPTTIDMGGFDLPIIAFPQMVDPNGDGGTPETCTCTVALTAIAPLEYWPYYGRYDPSTGGLV